MAGIRQNFLSYVVSTGVNLLGQLLLVPVFLHAWGQNGYGDWLVLSSIPTTISLAELGLNNAFANAFVVAWEGGEKEKARRIARSVWWFQVVLFVSLTTIVGGAALVAPIAEWMKISVSGKQAFAACAGFLGVYASASIVSGYYAAFYRAAGRNEVYVHLTTAWRVAELGVTVAILAGGGGTLPLSGAMALVKVLQVIWLHGASGRVLPKYGDAHGEVSLGEVLKLAPSGLAFFGYSAGNAVINQGAVVVVQRVLGPAAVVQFNVARQLARVFLQGTGMIFNSVHPEMNLAYARGDYTRVGRLQAQSMTPFLWLTPFAAVLVFFAGPWAISLWTQGKVTVAPVVASVFFADAMSYGLSGTALLAAWSSNRHVKASGAFLVLQAVALAVGGWALRSFGIAGLAGCFAVANLLQTAFASHVSATIVGCGTLELWREAALGRALLQQAWRRMPAR